MYEIEYEQFKIDAVRHLHIDNGRQYLPSGRNPLWEQYLIECVKDAIIDGNILEFGVGAGASLTLVARYINPRIIHGFDSFRGIPESWGGWSSGEFKQDKVPTFPDNVQLHIGMFTDTLPDFLSQNKQNISFMHVDCDLYKSAKCVLDCCRQYIVPGTIICFDEICGLNDSLPAEYFREHEFRALMESGLHFDVIRGCIASCTNAAVGIRIKK